MENYTVVTGFKYQINAESEEAAGRIGLRKFAEDIVSSGTKTISSDITRYATAFVEPHSLTSVD